MVTALTRGGHQSLTFGKAILPAVDRSKRRQCPAVGRLRRSQRDSGRGCDRTAKWWRTIHPSFTPSPHCRCVCSTSTAQPPYTKIPVAPRRIKCRTPHQRQHRRPGPLLTIACSVGVAGHDGVAIASCFFLRESAGIRGSCGLRSPHRQRLDFHRSEFTLFARCFIQLSSHSGCRGCCRDLPSKL